MNKGLAKSRWWRLIPVIFITYSLAYLDRANYSFGAASGLEHDLKITAATSSLLGSLFFLGYFFFQVPSANFAEKRSAKKLVFWALIVWGMLATATGLVSNVPTLMVIRFSLGIVEAAVMPAMLVFISHWFTKAERSKANTFLILGNPVTVMWMSVVSGYLVQNFGWRMMFISEGLPAIIWAILWWFLICDHPNQAKWLSKQEKANLQSALEEEQKGIKEVKDYKTAFKSKTVILLCAQYFLWSLGLYGFVMWLPKIIEGASDMGMVATGWLAAVPYIFAATAMILVSFFSDKKQDRAVFVWPFLLIGAIAFIGSFIFANHFWISYSMLVIAGAAMYAPYGPFFAIIPEILPRNVAGGAMALINSMGALGSFVGSYLTGLIASITGSFTSSYLLLAGALIIGAILTIIAVKAGNSFLNKKPVQNAALKKA
ncbi:MAG: MFS transporter [Bacillus sp. (in: firmicutes)]